MKQSDWQSAMVRNPATAAPDGSAREATDVTAARWSPAVARATRGVAAVTVGVARAIARRFNHCRVFGTEASLGAATGRDVSHLARLVVAT